MRIGGHSLSARNPSLLLPALLAFSFLLYANTLSNGFVQDDFPQIVSNPYVHSFKYLPQILTTTAWSFQGAQGQTNFYRPLMTFTFLLAQKLFGGFPFGFHLISLLLHVVVVWLVYRVAMEMLQDRPSSLLAALLFAIHPIHTESVDWIADITDLELAVFFLLSFWCFFRLQNAKGNASLRLHIAMAFAFALALCSKEPAFALVFLAPLFEHFFRSDRQSTSPQIKFSRYATFLILGALYLLLRSVLLGGVVPVLRKAAVSWPDAIVSSFALYGSYFTKLFWPHPLLGFYVFHKSSSFLEPAVLLGLLAFLASLTLVFVLRRNSPYHAFAILWFIFTLGPVLNARWLSLNVFAERYLYLPSVAFCWLVAGGIVWFVRASMPGKGLRLAASVCVVSLCSSLGGWQIVRRAAVWHDDQSFCESVLYANPNASYIRASLGVDYWNDRHQSEATKQWELALHQDPDNWATLSRLGMAKAEQGQYADALAYLDRVLLLRPNYVFALERRAEVFVALGRQAEAEADLRSAVGIMPLSTSARNALGNLLFNESRDADAQRQFTASLDVESTPDAWKGLARIYARQASPVLEERAWKNVLSFSPFDAEAHSALADLYLQAGRARDAEAQYRAVLLMNPHDHRALAGLAKLKLPASSREK